MHCMQLLKAHFFDWLLHVELASLDSWLHAVLYNVKCFESTEILFCIMTIIILLLSCHTYLRTLWRYTNAVVIIIIIINFVYYLSFYNIMEKTLSQIQSNYASYFFFFSGLLCSRFMVLPFMHWFIFNRHLVSLSHIISSSQLFLHSNWSLISFAISTTQNLLTLTYGDRISK